jgi:hypothetical protein
LGFGLRRLLNGLREHEDVARSIVEGADPAIVAAAISNATPSTANNLGELLSAFGCTFDRPWRGKMRESLDREKLMRLAPSCFRPKSSLVQRASKPIGLDRIRHP